MIDIAWITCDALGCTNGQAVAGSDVRSREGHDWYCQEHDLNHRED